MKKKIPKYILNLLNKRKIAASNFLTATYKITEWLEKENIPVNYTDQNGRDLGSYIDTGCISLCEPDIANEGFVKIIEEYFNENPK